MYSCHVIVHQCGSDVQPDFIALTSVSKDKTNKTLNSPYAPITTPRNSRPKLELQSSNED